MPQPVQRWRSATSTTSAMRRSSCRASVAGARRGCRRTASAPGPERAPRHRRAPGGRRGAARRTPRGCARAASAVASAGIGHVRAPAEHGRRCRRTCRSRRPPPRGRPTTGPRSWRASGPRRTSWSGRSAPSPRPGRRRRARPRPSGPSAAARAPAGGRVGLGDSPDDVGHEHHPGRRVGRQDVATEPRAQCVAVGGGTVRRRRSTWLASSPLTLIATSSPSASSRSP